jgi:rare lipoprotein A
LLVVLTALIVLSGCASSPPSAPGTSVSGGPAAAPGSGAWFATDGPPDHIPVDLDRLADATPRPETIRLGGPNKPYRIDGRLYEPFVDDRPLVERGLASWYGRKYHGRQTSMGERYDMFAMTAAHPTMPLPSYARVTNPANRRSIIVRINDRGPFVPGRVIDLSYASAHRLGVLRGVAPVVVERLTHDAMRAQALLSGEEFSARR